MVLCMPANPVRTSGIKHAVVDILVTVLIVAAVTMNLEWARWIILIYTPVILVLKLIALASPGIRTLKVSPKEPPKLLLHLLYGVNVVVLGIAAWWYLFAGWIAIWILSIVQDRRK